jgi:site-specific recombinase XerD
MSAQLEPLEPEQALEMYLEHRRDEVAESTLNAHRLRLKHFVRWCNEQEIDNLNELTGRKLFEYRQWRKQDGGLNRVSVRTQLSTLKQLIKFCETIDAVEPELHEKVDIPELKEGDGVRSVQIKEEQVEQILERLERFDYASLRHVIVLLLWRTAIRMGALRSIDVDDVDLNEGYIALKHRDEYGTPLKNGQGGERHIALTDKTVSVLNDWIEHRHPDTTDDYGRIPLVATEHGRISRSNIRRNVYWASSPQFVGEDCSCDVDEHDYDSIHECDDVVSPHAFRRGSITHMIRNEVPKEVVSGRSDVSPEVMDKHYNEMTEKEKMDQRREYLDNL